jgi:hypothetical protein
MDEAADAPVIEEKDGVRVLLRTMRKITGIAGTVGAKLRDRSRSVKWRVLEIARAARSKRAATTGSHRSG